MKKTIIIVLVWFVSLGLFCGLMEAMDQNKKQEILSASRITVEVGRDGTPSTIWDICSSINKSGKYNVHLLISVVKQMNNLTTSVVKNGQKLTIPNLGGETNGSY